MFFGLLVELEVQRMNSGFLVFICFGLQVVGCGFIILWNQWFCGVCMFIVLLVWWIISIVFMVVVLGSFKVVLMLVFSGIFLLLCRFLLVVMISLLLQLIMWLVIELGVKLLNIIEWIVLMCVQVSMVMVVLMIIGRQMVIWLFFLMFRLCRVLLRWQVCLYSLWQVMFWVGVLGLFGLKSSVILLLCVVSCWFRQLMLVLSLLFLNYLMWKLLS